MEINDICVIVPARNEEAVIEATLRSLIAAGMPARQIYLVDDCSSDDTGIIGFKVGVNVFRNDPNLGKAHAIARVVEVCRLSECYEFIALMDADTLVSDNYFSTMRKAFIDTDVVTVCGRPKSRPFNWITAYRAYGYACTHFVYRGAQSKMRVILVAPGCSTTYRSTIWNKLDWNKDTMVEDMDVTIQIQKQKLGRVIYAPEAIVYTQDPQTLADYGKQMLRWNTGNWQVIKKHKLYLLRHKIDWECTLLFGEGLIFSFLYLLLPFLVLLDIRFAYAAVFDLVIAMTMASVVSVTERRKDIFFCSLLFPFIRAYDSWMFIKGFWNVVVLGRGTFNWFTPARYSQEKIK